MVDNSSGTTNNFRSPVIAEPNLMPPSNDAGNLVLRTPFAGNVRALPPALPQSPMLQTQNMNYMGYGGATGMNMNYMGYGGSGYGGFGNYNSYNGMFGGGFSNYGAGGGMFNRYAANPLDPETRFIQLAEQSSRPAFQSIESLVMAIGNIANMLDSTFFALTSSFRAILGVAANFGRLRGVFAQFWQTFALFRSITWMYKKLLFWLRLSKDDPSKQILKKAFAEAQLNANAAPQIPQKSTSPWPVLAFLSFIFTAPYLIMKLLGTVTNTAQEEARNPQHWVKPIKATVLFDFAARNSGELSIYANSDILIAPKEIQNTLGLLNTGWALATIDNRVAGLVPVNYIKPRQQFEQEQALMQEQFVQQTQQEQPTKQQPELMNLSPAAFASPPGDFEIAAQPIGNGASLPTNLNNMAANNSDLI